MAGFLGGDKKEGIPKMSLLAINEVKDDAQTFINKLEDKSFGKFYAVDYANGNKEKVKHRVHAILAMVNKADTLEDYIDVLNSYKDYQIRFMTLANPELKNSTLFQDKGPLTGWKVFAADQVEEVKESLKKTYQSNLSTIELLFKKYDVDGGGQLDVIEL